MDATGKKVCKPKRYCNLSSKLKNAHLQPVLNGQQKEMV